MAGALTLWMLWQRVVAVKQQAVAVASASTGQDSKRRRRK
eukprot:CAMPEP_0171496274 /NCGR_PEP_ID=MMETSP0958-20121227/6608_1 /TAXON_ID=87120 /ORGANISM="Aurantiochytrium limacinum, Strain ATCCMYA-1381" /LENGTH=39 /DNA_ID= /DNA_START= /DNA_END= /DNA_ORIENTATION=